MAARVPSWTESMVSDGSGGEIEGARLRFGQGEARRGAPGLCAAGFAGGVVDGRFVDDAVVDVLEPMVEPAQGLGVTGLAVVPGADDQFLGDGEAVEGVDQEGGEGEVPPAGDDVGGDGGGVEEVVRADPAGGYRTAGR